MIDLAIKHKEQLIEQMRKIWFVEKYKFYNCDMYYSDIDIHNNTWDKTQLVSLNTNGDIIGYIGYSIDRQTNSATGLCAINFSDNKVTFGMDLGKTIIDIFEKFNFQKLKFTVIAGNPIESTYDKIVNKYGGRIVGTYHNDVKLYDSKLYDLKMYEIMKEEYLSKIKNSN